MDPRQGKSETAPVSLKRLLIVGIGASAGGLAAFKSFLAKTPADIGMAFVLVQHLAPGYKSLLVELLAAESPLPVITAVDGATVKAGTVYVIPPDTTLTIENGVLRLTSPAPARQLRRPIDSFLTSLAEDQGECAIGIVLAGTGSDGSLGVKAIKDYGGLTLAQAEFDHHAKTGMPQSATATGRVDYVLAVEDMPAKLVDYRVHLDDVAVKKDESGIRLDVKTHLIEILKLLKDGTTHDFSGYKETTLVRRLQRRMQVLQLDRVSEYVERLKKEPTEANTLFQEVLIGVTEFFRDATAFEALKAIAIEPLIRTARELGEPLRIWIAGCSTGEEVYTIAILIKEAMGQSEPKLDVKIFGTDIDGEAVSFARAARYRRSASGLSPERRHKWFIDDGADIRPTPEIREMCIFSVHSLVKDPPFSRLDLISCRNLLIYLAADLQAQVMRTFHFALKPAGMLFLGTSESVGRHENAFAVLDKQHRVLQRRDHGSDRLPPLPSSDLQRSTVDRPDLPSPRRSSADDRIDKSVRRIMEQYSPTYFVIDQNQDILRFSGSEARHFLEPSPGAASLHLFSILLKGLRPAVRAAVQRATASQATETVDNISVLINGVARPLTLIVEPIVDVPEKSPGCIVAFRESAPETASVGLNTAPPAPTNTVALERELVTLRSQLRAATDEVESTIEDMKSTTEEFQAVNEELQSSNEEIETAKEELHSINEELQTVNGELADRNDVLSRLNSDLQNLLDSTSIATVFLDDDLNIRHYTPAMTNIYPIRDSDRGRSIMEIVSLLAYDDIKADVAEVRANAANVQHEVSLKDGSATFLLKLQPYRLITGALDGVVLTFVDITAGKRAELHRLKLTKEVQHRSANLVAVIMSIADRTFSGRRTIDEEREIFAARLLALSKSQASLLEDPDSGASLDEIARRTLQGFGDRVTFTGPNVRLTADAAQAFALVIHELATNAAKYGALANRVGLITLDWSILPASGAGQSLAFHWKESDGLPVTPPTKKGFGSALLERSIPGGKNAHLSYEPAGLRYAVDCDLNIITHKDAPIPRT